MAVMVQARNNTQNTLTYSDEGITIVPNSTETIPNNVLINFASDVSVVSDILSGKLSIGNERTVYNGLSALGLLKECIEALSFPPLIPISGVSSSVDITSGQVLASNTGRKGLIIINVSSGVISLGIDSPAILYSGITLYPTQSWYMNNFSFTIGAINAIASIASCNLAIQEFES